MARHNQIHFRTEIAIEEGRLEEFKKLAVEMMRTVEANEPDTMIYEFCFDRSGTRCVVNEVYGDSGAALAHRNGVASRTILPKILSISKVDRLEVYGSPSEELQRALAGSNAHLYHRFVWIDRGQS